VHILNCETFKFVTKIFKFDVDRQQLEIKSTRQ